MTRKALSSALSMSCLFYRKPADAVIGVLGSLPGFVLTERLELGLVQIEGVRNQHLDQLEANPPSWLRSGNGGAK
jgi:hypothetical protein